MTMFEPWLSPLTDLFSSEIFVTVGALSGLMFVGSLIAIPLILIRLPSDYFDERVPRTWMKDHHPVLRWMGLVIKNIVGLIFLLVGLAMLVLPGQGILTMLIGISLMDFPGKRRLEATMIGQPVVLKAINSIREKCGIPPLILAPGSESKKHPDHTSNSAEV